MKRGLEREQPAFSLVSPPRRSHKVSRKGTKPRGEGPGTLPPARTDVIGPRKMPGKLGYLSAEKRVFDHQFHGALLTDYPDTNLSYRIRHGTSSHERIGNRIYVSNLNIRGAVRMSNYFPKYREATHPAPFHPYQRLRMMVVVDRFPTHLAVLNLSELLSYPHTADSFIDTFRNVDNFERFQVLHDEVISVPYQQCGFVTMRDPIIVDPTKTKAKEEASVPDAPAPNAVPDGSEQTQFWGVADWINFNISLKPNIYTEYAPDPAELPDKPPYFGVPLRNSLFLMMIPEYGHIQDHDLTHIVGTYTCRLKFYDV